MSVEPQALERSVLERKERDELAAIAEAMGVKAGARTSKANLIGQILREAGIETTEEKPKRAAKPKAENGATKAEAAEQADAPDETSEKAEADSRGEESTPGETDEKAEGATETVAEQAPSEPQSDAGSEQ